MKVIELIRLLIELNPNKDILISTDEEGNYLYDKAYIDEGKYYYRLYVVKGTEVDD